ncbi:hypothetical protein B0H16DRAFT_1833912 [Mycena metata]|uniref:Uncharacterized protein n=1 Tax=Mycena metata TaxID=1033252 RepID=A0AAD7J142_9AGAR|nr:hypothetical protein B0H16DRAFT_1833912 [Mycena metata]
MTAHAPAAADECQRTASGNSAAGAHANTEGGAYPRQTWDYVEEVVQLLKTTFPLLVLSLETIVDQVAVKSKSSIEEHTYRHLVMLISDALSVRICSPNFFLLSTTTTINRFGVALSSRVKAFGLNQTVYEYIQKLQQWRTRYERNLDSKPRIQPLIRLSHYLTEFQYMNVDEIEVPGQCTEDKDSNQNFIRMQKFGPTPPRPPSYAVHERSTPEPRAHGRLDPQIGSLFPAPTFVADDVAISTRVMPDDSRLDALMLPSVRSSQPHAIPYPVHSRTYAGPRTHVVPLIDGMLYTCQIYAEAVAADGCSPESSVSRIPTTSSTGETEAEAQVDR